MKTVTFCGHRTIAPSNSKIIRERLYEILERLIREGATEFLLGGYGTFDYLCAKAVFDLKEKYPHIISVLVIPYIDMDYDRSLYDISEYPPIENVPRKFAILKRNEYMVRKADVVVSYVEFSFGGAAKTLQYAKRKKKNIISVAED